MMHSHALRLAMAVAGALSAPLVAAQTVTIDSNAFKQGADLDAQQASDAPSCGGKNVSPELHWGDAPTGTKSFALTLFDPNARGGAGAWHWLVRDMPATTMTLPAGAGAPGHAPTGSRVALNDMGAEGYTGPCPPPGESAHSYVFTIYALGVEKLDVPADANAATIVAALKSATIASGRIEGKYAR